MAEPPSEAAPAQRRPWTRADVLWLAVALLATAGVYARSLAGQLVYDDLQRIARNPLITSLGNLPAFFTRPYWDFLDPGSAEQIGYWRPLAAVFQTVAWVAGNGSPVTLHVACVLVHLGAVAAAFALARGLSGSTWIAGASALLFGLHPAHVESVAWISALNDPLFGLWALLALSAYLGWRRRGSRGVPRLAALWFALALLSKEMGTAVLPVVVALDLGRTREPGEPAGFLGGLSGWRRALAPFALVLGLYYVARVFVFDSVAAGLERVPTHFGVGASRLFLLRLELLGGALKLLAWPAALSAFRPFHPTLDPLAPDVLAAGVALLLGLAVLALLLRRHLRPELAAALALLAGIAPMLVSVGSLGRFPLSDRFLYAPAFGFVLLLALGLRRLVPARVAQAALCVVALLYGARTFARIDVWHDERAFFTAASRESPRSPYVLWGLGRVLLLEYNRTHDPAVLTEVKTTIDRASDLLEEAKRPASDLFVTSNDYLQVNLERGWYHVFEAQTDEFGSYATAIAIFEELARRVGELEDQKRAALAVGVRAPADELELDLVYAALGTAHRAAGHPAQAEEALHKALSLDPRNTDALRTLGRVYADRGDWKLAIQQFEQALALQPKDEETELLLAQACLEVQDFERAETLARELLERAPARSEPATLIASIRLARRDPREALVWLDRALRTNPNDADAWYKQASAWILLGTNPEATIQAYRRATELAPRDFAKNYDFGAYLLTRAPQAALPYLVRAYGLTRDERLSASLFRTLASPELDYDAPDGLLALARIEIARDRWDLAQSWLERARATFPEHGPTMYLAGRVLQHVGRNDEALALLRQACERMPDDFVAASELGYFLIDLGRKEEARPFLERALTLRPPQGWEPEAAQAALERVRQALAAG